MTSKILGLLAVGLLAGPMAGNAAVVTYNVSGTFEDSSTFAGTIGWDFGDETDCSVASTFAHVTSGAVLYNYFGPNNVECSTPEAVNGGLIYASDFSSFIFFDFSPNISPIITSFVITGDKFLPGTSLRIVSGSGTRNSAVPEPGTLALLGLGLAGLGLSHRRKAD